MSTETWQSIAQRKQAHLAASIPEEWRLKSKPGANRSNVLDVPRECGLLSDRELGITEKCDATDLVREMAAGRLKSEDVVRAFCKVCVSGPAGGGMRRRADGEGERDGIDC